MGQTGGFAASSWLVRQVANAAPSFLLLRFLCRYKENEVAVGQTRRFCFSLWGLKVLKKESNKLTI
jgi:hypothetical protein